MSRHLLLLTLFVSGAVALVACNNTPASTDAGPTGDAGSTVDTGPTADTGHDTGGGGGVCETAMAVTLPMGMFTFHGDTTGHTTGLVDIGANCGGQMAGEMQAPEQALAITLPGMPTDHVAVNYTLGNMGTAANFDTTTQVRTSCASSTGAMCFDDISANDYRSQGSIVGMGGQMVFLIVTGFRMPDMMHVNSGPYEIDFTTYVNPQPPTLASGDSSLLDGDLLTVHATGMDPQSAAASLQISFLDAMSNPIGFDIDMNAMTPDVTDLGPYGFTPSIIGMMNFTGTLRITGFMPFPQALTATQLRISVIDSATLQSNEIMIPLAIAHTVHVGDACDTTHVCPGGVDCTGTPAVCTVPAAVAAACGAATALTIATPTTTTTSTMTTVDYGTGTGNFEGSCIGQGGMGDDHVLSVMVPTGGPFDLIADAPQMGEMGVDTVIYDRTVCGDPSTEDACNDDASAMPHIVASHMVVQNAAPGMHFIIADTFQTQTMSAMVPITVSLRPVLATGAACDPMELMNRCGTMPCPTTGTATCP